jgi:uncharacterized membrane protein YgcG
MLMTAAVRMDSTTTSPTPPPWFPVVPPAGNHRLPYDYDGFTAPAPSPTPAAAAAPPNHHLRPEPTTRRAASKRRRPRPSRKLPTTYITADDPASFRRMVHQVTGADDNLPAADAPPPPPAAPLETLCCRPAPYRTPGAVILPTLDTSAFLIGAPAPGLDRRMEAAAGGGGGGACNNYSSNSNSNSGSSCGGGGGGFPTLDSWDDALF